VQSAPQEGEGEAVRPIGLLGEGAEGGATCATKQRH